MRNQSSISHFFSLSDMSLSLLQCSKEEDFPLHLSSSLKFLLDFDCCGVVFVNTSLSIYGEFSPAALLPYLQSRVPVILEKKNAQEIHPGLKEGMLSPLLFSKKVFGLLFFGSFSEGIYLENTLLLSNQIASLIAGTLERFYLQNELEELRKNLQKQRELLKDVLLPLAKIDSLLSEKNTSFATLDALRVYSHELREKTYDLLEVKRPCCSK
ncbi:MAG: GAF domain-containing protein [Chlamydiales bacterium]